MAEGIARALFPKNIIVQSAGTEAHGLNPIAMQVMDDISISISKHESTQISDKRINEFDMLITLCGDARDKCPILDSGATIRRCWTPSGAQTVSRMPGCRLDRAGCSGLAVFYRKPSVWGGCTEWAGGAGGLGWAYRAVQSAGADIPHPAAAAPQLWAAANNVSIIAPPLPRWLRPCWLGGSFFLQGAECRLLSTRNVAD